MAKVTIERLDGRWVGATYVRHLRTLTTGGRNEDVELYRLADGAEIECISDAGDARSRPSECDPRADHYPGHPAGA